MTRKRTTADIERNVLFKELNADKYKPRVLNKSPKKKIRQWKQHLKSILNEESNEESDEMHHS